MLFFFGGGREKRLEVKGKKDIFSPFCRFVLQRVVGSFFCLLRCRSISYFRFSISRPVAVFPSNTLGSDLCGKLPCR